MNTYFTEHGSAIEYQVEGRWIVKGDYFVVVNKNWPQL